jgi:hypothetical protein
MNKNQPEAEAEALTLKVETHDLTSLQLRLLKHVHTLLVHVLAAEDETEYFEASSHLLKQTVQLIRHANFAENHQGAIPYGQQAVEYAIDSVNEVVDQGVCNLDN